MGLDLHLGTPSNVGSVARSLRVSENDGNVYAEMDGKWHLLIPAPIGLPDEPGDLLDIEDAVYHDYDYVRDEPCHARWSYGGFHRFRDRLAATIGVTLEDMRGFSGDKVPVIEWEDVDSGLVPLLHHSDCDGELGPVECAEIAPALREAIAKWPAEPGDYDTSQGLHLADMCERAGNEGMTLMFG